MEENNDVDRPNALLTKKDREWLVADEPLYTGDSAPQQRYRRRTSIRERVKASLFDLQLLFEHLDDEQRGRVFDAIDTSSGASAADARRTGRAFRNAIADALGFLYLGTLTSDYGFEYYLNLGVGRAEDRIAGDGELVNAQVDFSVKRKSFPPADMESIVERVRDGGTDELTEHELREYTKLTAEMDEFDPESILQAGLDRYTTGVESTDHDGEP